jgi:hypothetical protein
VGLRSWLSHLTAPDSGRGYGPQRSRETVSYGDGDKPVKNITLERHTLDDLVRHAEARAARIEAFRQMLGMYRITRRFPDLSDFRLGPNMFERIPMDWIIFVDADGPRASLVGHGIATRIRWNGDPKGLPRGWQGAVRESYQLSLARGEACDTLVGLFINVEAPFREQGWSERIVGEMKRLGAERGLSNFVVPLRLPRHYEKEYAAVPFDEFARLRRPDGEYLDHWLRLHVRLGAELIGLCHTSHQHAMNLDDLRQQFECPPFPSGGYHLVSRDGEWYRAFVDLDRDCAVINQGCAWVQHPLSQRQSLRSPNRGGR